MENGSFHQKAIRPTTNAAAQRVSTGPEGLAIAPPQNRTGLPDELKEGVENLSGLSLDDVRVYYNSSRPAELQALAYTQGMDIHVAPGQERHLPHEAWHVVQQKQGRVKSTMHLGVSAVNDDPGLEQEADQLGTRAMGMPLNWAVLRRVAQPKSVCSAQTAQLKKNVTDNTMENVAKHVQGDSTHSTTAITKEADESYKVYAQQKTTGMGGRIDEYDNLKPGDVDNKFHAEVLALANDLTWTKIAASQPICLRCQAILTQNNKTGVNNGKHYTEYWQAPGTYDIDGKSPYPAGVDHRGGDGSHGTRWTRKENEAVKHVNGEWQKVHKAPW